MKSWANFEILSVLKITSITKLFKWKYMKKRMKIKLSIIHELTEFLIIE